MRPIVLQQQLLLLLLFPLDCNTDINQNRQATVGENCDLTSLIQCISLAVDAFWHWSHSHRNRIFLLLWKSTAFLPPRSYLPSFHNKNLIKSQRKQPLHASKNPNCQWMKRTQALMNMVWWQMSSKQNTTSKEPPTGMNYHHLHSCNIWYTWTDGKEILPFACYNSVCFGAFTEVNVSSFYPVVLENWLGQPVTRCLLIESTHITLVTRCMLLYLKM